MILDYISTNWIVQAVLLAAICIIVVVRMLLKRSVAAQQMERQAVKEDLVHDREMWTLKQGAVEHKKD